jgi:release factor glutamine methyltransferase
MENTQRINTGDWLAQAKSRLTHSETPGLEAQLILAHVLQLPRAVVLAHPERKLSLTHEIELEGLLAKLSSGVPLPYLLGIQEFYGLQFIVNPSVLIPRPETELLVDVALEWLQTHPEKCRAADVGTGSGCITAALLSKVTNLKVLAVDRSRAALETARENFLNHGLAQRTQLVQGDLLSCWGSKFDLVCANLPYIPSKTLQNLPVARHEPLAALDGGEDGLQFIRKLLEDAGRWMAPGGLMLLEIEAGQEESAPTQAKRILGEHPITLVKDLAGKPRLLKIQF